jgi:signal peptidase
VAFGTENPFYVVSSGSMIPNLNIFDVIIVQGHVNFDQLKVGDIIVFNRPNGHDKVIVHRVAEILNKDPLVIRTKGDANPGSIPGTDFPITKDDYIGKVEYVIPQIGYVTRILTPPINYIIIAVIVGIMLVKQFGKPKSNNESLSDNNLDTTKNSDEWDTKSYSVDLSNNNPDLIKDSAKFESKIDDKSENDKSIEDKDSDKKQD